MTKAEINSAPVTLAAGSYDYEALKKGLDQAAKGADGKYESAVDKAIDSAAENAFDPINSRDTPGYRYQDVENKQLGVTETIQVYDPKLAGDVQDAAPIVTDQSAVASNPNSEA